MYVIGFDPAQYTHARPDLLNISPELLLMNKYNTFTNGRN